MFCDNLSLRGRLSKEMLESKRMSRNRLYVFLLSVVLLLPITNYAAEQDFKNTLIDEVDVSGTGYYGRLLVVGDDNDDGIKESIYLKLSPKYMEYVWKPGWEVRRRTSAAATPA